MKTFTFLLIFVFVALSSAYYSALRQDKVKNVFLGLEQTETGAADPETLNIHIIPHSHDDLGWLKTVDEYYQGDPYNPRSESVKKILDSLVPVLKGDPNKKFIYVEMGFFKKWWNEQTDEIKNQVHQFVKNGQLEFINGGYAMNDEADVYYEDSIEQMALGHQFLLQNFNVTPEVGWHIDPFGHANAQAALFAQMGFKAFFVARIDYQDKNKRLNEQSMEMLWIPETSQGIENAIFTHVNYHHYSNPQSFCFDTLCNDEQISDYNLDNRADSFANWFKNMRKSYKTTELIHTAGDDFNYMVASRDFQNYDKLFQYIQNKKDSYHLNVFYSTPSQYLNAVYPLNLEYPVKKDDFFPYADKANAYWTGYFTSRPAIKELTRQEGRFLQAVRRIATQSLWKHASDYVQNNFNTIDNSIGKLEDALAIAQHHDAVAGTEKQLVVEDYEKRFSDGDGAVKQNFLYPFFKELIKKDLGIDNIQLTTCDLNRTSVHCETTYTNLKNNVPVLVAIYNSGPSRQSLIRVKVSHGKVQASLPNGTAIQTDVICANAYDENDCDLFFSDNFKGYDTAYYYLTPTSQSNEVTAQNLALDQVYNINPTQTISVTLLNGALSKFNLKQCKDTGLTDCYTTQFNLNYNYYPSYQDWDWGSQKSGAYIFRPGGAVTTYATPQSGKVYLGKNLLQIHLDCDRVLANIRIPKDLAKGIEVESYLDSIPVDDNKGKEVVLSVEVPSINNQNVFYTDSMGMELQKRVINFRPTWDLQVTEPVAGNYYPVQSTILIKDETSGESLAVLPDRSQGGSSLKNGQLELMIHRRILYDDARGVGEPLNELDTDGRGLKQWVTHVLLFNKPGYLETSHRQSQMNIDNPNLVLLGAASNHPAPSPAKVSMTEGSIFGDLNNDIKWMTKPLSLNKFLFRFQNMGETETKTVNTGVFTSSTLGKGTPVEMSLTANQPKTDMISKKFNWNGLQLNNPSFANTDYLNSDQFSLRPLEIRTFIVTFVTPEAISS